MKTEFKMTEDELEKMKSISQDNTPVMKFGNYWSGLDKQERANTFWKELADKYGFVLDSAGPSDKGIMYFMAESNKITQQP
jgi:hypothetical protein